MSPVRPPRPTGPVDRAPARLILVGGPPASGKSTLAAHIERERDAVRLTPDDWLAGLGRRLEDGEARERVERLQEGLMWELLGHRLVVVLDWGVFTREKRDRLRTGARALGADVELHFLEPPAEVLWARIESRRRAGEGGAPARAAFERMLGELDVPDAAERGLFDPPPTD